MAAVTVILDLTDATYVADSPQFRDDLINSLIDISSPENDAQFQKCRDLMLADTVTAVVRNSDTQVTLTIPATPDYDIETDGELQALVPGSVLV